MLPTRMPAGMSAAGVAVAKTLAATEALRRVLPGGVSASEHVEAAGAGLLLGRLREAFTHKAAGRVLSEIAALKASTTIVSTTIERLARPVEGTRSVIGPRILLRSGLGSRLL